MKKYFYLIICSFIGWNITTAQTANITRGCVPLTVGFTAPMADKYFWDFGNGNNSQLQNPAHTFTDAGQFTVILRREQAGPEIGRIVITAYAEPVIEITASPQSGCSPLVVNFGANISLDPGIKIIQYEWTFGDGETSNALNPNHRYSNAREYNVGLKITTDAFGCNKTVLKEKLIKVEGVEAKFKLDKDYSCTFPATFNITEVTPDQAGNTYSWLINGVSSTVHNINSFTIPNKGTYIIKYTVRNAAGCETSVTDTVVIGPPKIDITAPDTVCFGQFAFFQNRTAAWNFEWNFQPGADIPNSTQRGPINRFYADGPVTVKLKASTDPSCFSDTTFVVIVERPDTGFTINPRIECKDPITVKVSATNRKMARYIYNDTIEMGPDIEQTFKCPVRDSLHTNRTDTFFFRLIAITSIGCRDTSKKSYFIHQKPDAHFVPNKTRGCAPLDVTFNDVSTSHKPIKKWTYIFGDGQTEMHTTNNPPIKHIYNSPGEYYAKLIIENEEGCVDTSFGVWIFVGVPIAPQYTIDKKEICLNDSVRIEITNKDSRIDGVHVSSDDFRFSHCWVAPGATHGFVTEPGQYDVSLMIDYNGCISERVERNLITVKGANANIGYMVNCATPNDIMFRNEGKNGNALIWNLGDRKTSMLDSFTHKYDTTGNYKVILSAQDPQSGCPADLDSTTVYVRNITAEILMPDTVCDRQIIILNARPSNDVDRTCNQGFIWYLPDGRPRENNKDTIHHVFYRRGEQKMVLVTKDINGCRDTFEKDFVSVGIDPNFIMSTDRICYPSSVTFNDKSVGDLPIVKWDWSFGSDKKDVTHRFENGPPRAFQVVLAVEDSHGCVDTFARALQVYRPRSFISAVPNGICVNGEIQFFSTQDFGNGSFLRYEWNFGNNDRDTMQNPKRVFNTVDSAKVIRLKFTEAKTGCTDSTSLLINVVPKAVAKFSNNPNENEVICHPKQIEFTNESTGGGFLSYQWRFGSLATSTLKNPSETFPKGTHTVTLVANSIYGCADSTTKTFTLIGPEGAVKVEDSLLCQGEEFSAELINLIDVDKFLWDFRDGNTNATEKKIRHKYDSNVANVKPVVTLFSKDGQCVLDLNIPVSIANINGYFDTLGYAGYCPNIVYYKYRIDSSQFSYPLPDMLKFDFGDDGNIDTTFKQDNIISEEIRPDSIVYYKIIKVKYNNLGRKNASLTLINSNYDCEVKLTNETDLNPADLFFDFPNIFSPNGDKLNDYFYPALKQSVPKAQEEEFKGYMKVLQFKIYNRFGQLVYNNEDPANGWNGIFKDEPAPSEVYAYYIQVEIDDCEVVDKKGNVTLVR